MDAGGSGIAVEPAGVEVEQLLPGRGGFILHQKFDSPGFQEAHGGIGDIGDAEDADHEALELGLALPIRGPGGLGAKDRHEGHEAVLRIIPCDQWDAPTDHHVAAGQGPPHQGP